MIGFILGNKQTTLSSLLSISVTGIGTLKTRIIYTFTTAQNKLLRYLIFTTPSPKFVMFSWNRFYRVRASICLGGGSELLTVVRTVETNLVLWAFTSVDRIRQHYQKC